MADRPRLLNRVWSELGAGRIREGYVSDPHQFIDGYIEGQDIWINPAPAVVQTLIHEILHRLYPNWTERYVAGQTTRLMRRMSDQEVQDLYEEYQKRVKRSR
jgi:hypothetical protein